MASRRARRDINALSVGATAITWGKGKQKIDGANGAWCVVD